MARKPDLIAQFDAYGAEERALVEKEAALRLTVARAEAQLAATEASLAEVDTRRIRGRATDADVAGVERDVEAARAAIAGANREVAAARRAMVAVRMDRGELIREHRSMVFMPAAREHDKMVRAAAADAIASLDQLGVAVRDAATAIDRMRPRDRQTGVVNGAGAEPPVDLAAMRGALALIVERGMTWPQDVDPETGAPVSARERFARVERERDRQLGRGVPLHTPLVESGAVGDRDAGDGR